MQKGKQGRLCQNKLGERIDYSGRSVIVDGLGKMDVSRRFAEGNVSGTVQAAGSEAVGRDQGHGKSLDCQKDGRPDLSGSLGGIVKRHQGTSGCVEPCSSGAPSGDSAI